MYKIQSPFYSYYYISKDDLSDYWSTKEIDQFILSYQGFVMESPGGFNHKKVFLSISLMMIKSHDSWSGLDYDFDKTNYIAIVTSKKVDPLIKDFFDDLVCFMGSSVIEEED